MKINSVLYITLVASCTNMPSENLDRENSLDMQFKGLRVNSNKVVYICKHETTNKNFDLFMQNGKINMSHSVSRNLSHSDHPVVNVTYYEAIKFCDWLTKFDKKNGFLSKSEYYRLLDEKEAILLDRGRCGPNDANILGEESFGTRLEPTGGRDSSYYEIGHRDQFVYTSPIGSFIPDKIGLYDVSGNAGEMYTFYPDDSNWIGIFGDTYRSNYNSHDIPYTRTFKDSKLDYLGFRIVIDKN